MVTLTTGSVRVGAGLSTASATLDELRNRVYQNTYNRVYMIKSHYFTSVQSN